ncbi:MAG: hypothetical protein HN368_06395 [Spirochaetales bacterium]|jgi:hypothetical protein|nr:hypothetical protein [Spirochaetales bacterium]
MSGDVLTKLSDLVLRPRVVHNLPGRMRIYLPALKRVTEEMIPEGMYESIAGFFPGVTSFSPNCVTGNILVEYDTSVISESEVLSSLTTATKTFVAYRSQLSRVAADRRDEIFRRIKDHLISIPASRLAQAKELKLPDEIWN